MDSYFTTCLGTFIFSHWKKRTAKLVSAILSQTMCEYAVWSGYCHTKTTVTRRWQKKSILIFLWSGCVLVVTKCNVRLWSRVLPSDTCVGAHHFLLACAPLKTQISLCSLWSLQSGQFLRIAFYGLLRIQTIVRSIAKNKPLSKLFRDISHPFYVWVNLLEESVLHFKSR